MLTDKKDSSILEVMYIYNNLKPTLASTWEVLQLENKNMKKLSIDQLNGIAVIELSDLNQGEYFKLKPDSKKVYERGEYLRAEKKYRCADAEIWGRERFLKPDTVVYTQFEF